MRSILLAGLVGSTGLVSAAVAQTPAPGVNICEELVRFVEARRDAQPASPVTLDQARGFHKASDLAACRDGLLRIERAGIALPAALVGMVRPAGAAEGANIVVQQPASTVRVEQGSPQVTVQQPQPEIIVRQPQPTVTVDIPQPEIIVRMPKPDVNVTTARPEVQVLNSPPEVQVQPTQPNIQVQNPGEPNVRYEGAEPRVVVNQAPKAQIRVERAGETADADQERITRERIGILTPERAAPAPATAPKRTIRVSALEEMQVYNARGERLGEVENMVMSPADNSRYLVVEHGGFLGLFQDKVALPLSRVMLQGDRLVVQGLSEEEFEALANWRVRLPNARPVDVTSSAELRVAG